jgi:plasmid maintenance system killer protein
MNLVVFSLRKVEQKIPFFGFVALEGVVADQNRNLHIAQKKLVLVDSSLHKNVVRLRQEHIRDKKTKQNGQYSLHLRVCSRTP